MRAEVKLPSLGETTDAVVVVEWFFEEGDLVEVGDPLLLVETNKTEVEVPSPIGGVLVRRHVELEDEILTGVVLAVIETSDSAE